MEEDEPTGSAGPFVIGYSSFKILAVQNEFDVIFISWKAMVFSHSGNAA
jgi:hypothetical protein